MPRIKRYIHTGFTTVNNVSMRDATLSIAERGLLVTMLSLPDGWNMSGRGLAAILPDGRDKIFSTLRKLEAKGYLRRIKIRMNGRFEDTEYQFCDVPVFREENEKNTQEAVKEIDIKKELENADKETKKVTEEPNKEVKKEIKKDSKPKPKKAKKKEDKTETASEKTEERTVNETVALFVEEKSEEQKKEIEEKFDSASGKELKKFVAKEIFNEKKLKAEKAVSEDFLKKLIEIFVEIIEKRPERRKELVCAGPLDVLFLYEETEKSLNRDLVIRKYFLEEGMLLR